MFCFLLTLLRVPRVSLTTVFLPPRETAALHPCPFTAPPPPLLRCPSAAAHAPPARHSKPPPRLSSPLSRRPRATPPLLRCCSTVARAPTPRLCHPRAAAHRHRRPLHTRAASPAQISLPRSSIQDRFDPSTLCLRRPQGVRGIAFLGFSSVSSLFCKGMTFTPCCKVKFL